MRWLLALFCLLPAAAQPLAPPCEAPAPVLATLAVLPPLRDFSTPLEERIGPLRALAQENPDSFFIQLYYQDAFRRFSHLSAEYDHALAMYRKRPTHPLSRYFEARLLMMAQPGKAKAAFEELMAANPRFVWPRLDMLDWVRLPGRRDPNEADSHWKAFLAVCSAPPEATGYLASITDLALLKRAVAEIRAALLKRDSALDLAVWPQFWSAESRAGVPQAEMDARIRADLKRIEARPFRASAELYWAHSQASEMLKAPAILAAFESRVEKEAPRSSLMLQLVRDRWHRENPQPPHDAGPDARRAQADKSAAALAEWRKRWPDDCNLIRIEWHRWVPATGRKLPPAAEVLPTTDAMLACRAQSPASFVSVPPVEVEVAGLYTNLGVRMDQVLPMLHAGQERYMAEAKYRISLDLIPVELRSQGGPDELMNRRSQETRLEYFVKANRIADARALVAQEIARLDAQATADESERRQISDRRLSWQLWLARATGERAPIRDVPRDWKPPAPAFAYALPEFTAADLAGRTWRLEDLKGRATLVNYWATWCGPCRGEHPDIQKLHERLKGRSELQVLTFSVDADPGLAAEYMKEKGYTFPVIRSPELADKVFPYSGLPANFIVNAEGRRTSYYPLMPGEPGLRSVIDEMEKAAGKGPVRNQ